MAQQSLASSCLEVSYFQRGQTDDWILGVDEVGRGALAGPIVAACCAIRQEDDFHPLVNDSKLLTPSKRHELYRWIRLHHRVSVAGISALQIDQWGIGYCNKAVMKWAVFGHQCFVNQEPILTTLIDGVLKLDFPGRLNAQNIIKGDRRSYAIACASIVAKHLRDYIMHRIARVVDGYSLEIHKGYATSQHIAALKKKGMSHIHRRTFCQSVLYQQERLF